MNEEIENRRTTDGILLERIDGVIKTITDKFDINEKSHDTLFTKIDNICESVSTLKTVINGIDIKNQSIQNEIKEHKVDHDKKENKVIAIATLFSGIFAWIISYFTKKNGG